MKKLAKKQKVLNILNSMEVVESNGGEEAYILVENNEENQELLKQAGISLETALKYGDEETFCILALAQCEGYADLYDGSKLVAFEEKFEMDFPGEQSVVLYKSGNEHRLGIFQDDGYFITQELSADQLDDISKVINKEKEESA
jgi:hypothetical protein